MKRIFTFAIVLTMCVASVSAIAADMEATQGKLLVIQYDYTTKVRYASGGFGKRNRDAMMGIQDEFNAHFVFAMEGTGAYVGEVDVTAVQDGIVVMRAVSMGPWFMVNLPPGTYTITANYDGVAKTQEITVTDTIEKYYFFWNQDEVEYEPMTTGA
ncbi:MAG: hypothetical protein ACOCWR_01910 [Oceanidesulfovibrio sp.]